MSLNHRIRTLIDETPFADTHEHLWEERSRIEAAKRGELNVPEQEFARDDPRARSANIRDWTECVRFTAPTFARSYEFAAGSSASRSSRTDLLNELSGNVYRGVPPTQQRGVAARSTDTPASSDDTAGGRNEAQDI